MKNTDDKRLIEDYLPIVAISAEASREKSVRKGHISTLHLWWARRPLVACRAAVYGALVPASRFVPANGTDEKKKSLGRANAARFVKVLCQYPKDSDPDQVRIVGQTVQEAQRHILTAHAERLSKELTDWKAGKAKQPGWVDEFKWKGDDVAMEDIVAGRAPRPRVLDMFAGGGAIPLEALRLGCEAYANDLNPVAHVIQLCTLVYPQKYGNPDINAKGMTGPNGTWGGLADEVRYWGEWVLKKVKQEIGDLYPPIHDPEYKGKRPAIEFDMDSGEWIISRHDAKTTKTKKKDPFADFRDDAQSALPPGYLMPVAYLWTRTVQCKNPACGATVPLVKQTWLCKKKGRYVAMKMIAPTGKKAVRFDVVEARSEDGLGFDPAGFSKTGNATCPFCGTVADDDYVKSEAVASRVREQLMAIVATRPGSSGKVYLDADKFDHNIVANLNPTVDRLRALQMRTGLTEPDEPIINDGKASFWCELYGVTTWKQVFSERQRLAILSFCAAIAEVSGRLKQYDLTEAAQAISLYLGLMASRMANFSSTLCLWNSTGGRGVVHSFSHQAVPFTWDYPESNPFYPEAAGWTASMDAFSSVLEVLPGGVPAHVMRGDSRQAISDIDQFDAVITDPPYYDNISYADLSDFFYVWLKRSIGDRFPEHFAGIGSPKKPEVVSDRARHAGNEVAAKRWFEENLGRAFAAGYKVLKPGGILTCVYAHKTTLGWATLVDALRQAGFMVSEAWPLSTERPGGMKVDKAMLASSIFLIARKRDAAAKAGNYEEDVVPELGRIVRERVETLWEMGISGADLVIACVGAGLRAFTKYPRVEFANGEEVPAERFLMEVEAAVLETILGKLSKTVGAKAGTTLSGLDPFTRFYVLWRYTYGGAELDAGEAIIFANGTHVELDGQHSLTAGARALLEKKKGKYKLLDFTNRGDDTKLGAPAEDGTPAAAVDALHRLLWLVEHKPPKIPDFLSEAKPNIEQLRLVVQALSGPALKGGDLADVSPSAEQSALGKLLANWNAVMVGKEAMGDKRAGQGKLF